MVVTMVMVVMMVVIIVMVVAVVVMSTMRWRISVELLPVVEVALVPRRWLLLRRVVRPLRWSLGRRILSARRRVRLRVPCGNRTEPGSDRSRAFQSPIVREKIRRCIARRVHARLPEGRRVDL